MKASLKAKKLLSIVLSLLLIISVCPVAFAADDVTGPCVHKETELMIPAKTPSCEEYGYTEQRKCKECGYVFKAQYQPATGHHYEMVDGSQNSDGVTYRCVGCLDSYVKNHSNWSYALLPKNPTCTQDGWTADKTCGLCGYHQESELLPATSHEYVTASSDTESHIVKCSKCDYVSGKEGHEIEFVFDGELNCYSNTVTGDRICKKCNYVAEADVTVSKGAHPNVKVSNKTEYKLTICADCNDTVISAERCKSCSGRLDSSEYSIKQPTCTQGGYLIYNCTCGYSDVISFDSIGHYQPNGYVITKNSTCQENGVKSNMCQRCDYSDTILLPKTSHIFTIVSPGYDATCEEDGLTNAGFCGMCGLYTTSVPIPATGHDLIEYYEVPFCVNCNKYMIGEDGEEKIPCKCLCHNGDGLAIKLFSLLMFFCKIFGIMQSCDCGAVHYEKMIG